LRTLSCADGGVELPFAFCPEPLGPLRQNATRISGKTRVFWPEFWPRFSGGPVRAPIMPLASSGRFVATWPPGAVSVEPLPTKRGAVLSLARTREGKASEGHFRPTNEFSCQRAVRLPHAAQERTYGLEPILGQFPAQFVGHPVGRASNSTLFHPPLPRPPPRQGVARQLLGGGSYAPVVEPSVEVRCAG